MRHIWVVVLGWLWLSAAPTQALEWQEQVLGRADAPITMIEYSSLTCPHCASFHADTLPRIKVDYIDTGKVRLIYRDFPLDRAALQAAQLAHCGGADRFFPILEMLFASQAQWSRADDLGAALGRIGRFAGLDPGTVAACLADQELMDGIIASRFDGQQRFAVAATPSFVINGDVVAGAVDYADFRALFDRLLLY